MSISSRIEGSIESWSQKWKDRLRGWLTGVIGFGIEIVLDVIGKKASSTMAPLLAKMEESGKIPPEIQPIFDELKNPSGEFSALLANSAGNAVVSGGLGRILDAMFLPFSYWINTATRNVHLDQNTYMAAWQRGDITNEELESVSGDLGTFPWSLEVLKKLQTVRLDPMSVITAWRRDPTKFAGILKDLKDQGWTDERIEALKFITEFIPSADEQTLWLAREVFEPEMVDRYGLDDELPDYANTDFDKIGVTPEQMTNKWRAHWEHASWNQVVEMLRRGQLTEAEVRDWFRLVEIPPFWRDKLIAISRAVPTRVDVRRFWDLRTIDEARLREIYTWQGYHGKDLEDYVLWTKIFVAFPDLMSRWRNGWITLDELRGELVDLGMPPERVETMIQTKVKAAQPERTTKERDLTKAEIVKGVKKDRITRDQGVDRLMDLGYDESEASFILDINIPVDEVVTEVKNRELTKTEIIKGLATGELDDAQALEKLIELRYTPDDAQFLLTIYTKRIRELAKADLLSAFRKDVLSEADALARLAELGYSPEDAQLLLTEKVEPPVEIRLKEASKADIVLGVKKGLITQEDGYMMLLDIGFAPAAAEFILQVRTEESPFSPINNEEFKALTAKWRRSAGVEVMPVTEELKAAAAEVVKVTREAEGLREAVKREEATLIPDVIIPEEQKARLDGLRASLRRAEAELARVKGEYDRLVAEWRHQEA